MRKIVALASLLLVGGQALAKHPRHHHAVVAARATDAPPATDELTLSADLVQQLQEQLALAGYVPGSMDGELSPQTRRALAEFQRDYHHPATGMLDLVTAEALLGYDRVSAFMHRGR